MGLPEAALSFLIRGSVLMLGCGSLSSLGSASASGAPGRGCSLQPRDSLLLLGHTEHRPEALKEEIISSYARNQTMREDGCS